MLDEMQTAYESDGLMASNSVLLPLLLALSYSPESSIRVARAEMLSTVFFAARMVPMVTLATQVGSQAAAFTYYSARALLDPTDADAVFSVGEITAVRALENMKRQMLESQTGRHILQQQPLIPDRVLETAREMPEGSFGRAYASFMDFNHFTPSGRTAATHVKDPLLAYIMTRYRQSHDFLHTCAGCGRTVQEEVAVKLLEYQHTGLPLGLLALPGGGIHLFKEQLAQYKHYWKWARANAPCSIHGMPQRPFYLNHLWETMLELPMEEVSRITGITPLPQ